MLKLTFTILSIDSTMILRMGYILSEAWGPISPEEYLYLIRVNCIFLEMKDSLLRKVLYGNLQRLWTL